MNFLKRASTSLSRRPGKAVILLLLLFVLGNIISGAIAIRQAVNNTEANLRAQLPPVASITRDQDAMMLAWNRGEDVSSDRITMDIVRQVGALPNVQNYDFSLTANIFSRELNVAQPRLNDDDLPEGMTMDDLQHNFWSLRDEGSPVEQFMLNGASNPSMIDMEAGLISLSGGSLFTQEQLDSGARVAIISREVADANGLSVGSTINMESNVYDTRELEESGRWSSEDAFDDEILVMSQEVQLEIIGIFEYSGNLDFSTPNAVWDNIWDLNSLVNRIYVPNVLIEELMSAALPYRVEASQWLNEESTVEDLVQTTAIFALDHPRYLNDFIEAGQEYLPDFWAIADLSGTFVHVTSSMGQMQWIANLVLSVAVAATIIILTLLITLFLRDRKQEIGIYLALGEAKGKVVSQILLEVMSVAVIAISLSLFTGNLLSQGMSRQMLQSDVQARQDESLATGAHWNEIPWELRVFSPGSLSVEEMVSAYDTSMDGGMVALFYGVGLGTLVISTVFPILYITRLDPKKIMM